MILTITPNPAMDLTYPVDRLEIGRTHRVRSPLGRAGGKGINVSSVLADLGSETTALLPQGGGTGEELLADTRRRGLTTVSVPIRGSTRRTLAVVADDGSTTNFSEPGPALEPQEWADLIRVAALQAERASAVVIAGSLPPGVDSTDLATLVRALRGRSTPVFVDVAGEALLAAAEAGADMLAPNLDELRQCFGDCDAETGAQRLIERGASAVLVSCGADGLLHVTGSEVLQQPAARGISGNTTGAGDAALAGFVAQHTRPGSSTAQALAEAAAAGAAAVLEPVAGSVSRSTVDKLLSALPPITSGERHHDPSAHQGPSDLDERLGQSPAGLQRGAPGDG